VAGHCFICSAIYETQPVDVAETTGLRVCRQLNPGFLQVKREVFEFLMDLVNVACPFLVNRYYSTLHRFVHHEQDLEPISRAYSPESHGGRNNFVFFRGNKLESGHISLHFQCRDKIHR
jgi:hypothetical protein